MPPKAVIFDLDDTLFPEREYVFSGYRAVALAFTHFLGDVEIAVARMCQLFDTPHRRRVFNQLLEERGLSDYGPLVHQMIDSYRRHRPTIRLFPDAERALIRLRELYCLGLITDGPALMQRNKIEAVGLVEADSHGKSHQPKIVDPPRYALDVILLTDELGPGCSKPHPRAFELAAEKLNVPAESCTYVADNPTKDFIAPNALGWSTIQIIRKNGVYCNVPPAPGSQPHQRIQSLDELDSMLPR